MRRKRGSLWVDLLLVAMFWIASIANFWRIITEGSSPARLTTAISFAVGGLVWLIAVLVRSRSHPAEDE